MPRSVVPLRALRVRVPGPVSGEIVTSTPGTIIQLGQALKVSTIAEGMESETELSRIEALGCDAGQGYLLGRPVAPAVLEGLLQPREVA